MSNNLSFPHRALHCQLWSFIMPLPHFEILGELFWVKLKRQFEIITLMVILAVFICPIAIFILLPTSLVLRLVVKLIAAVFRPDLSQIFSGKALIFALDSIYTNPKINIVVYLFCNKSPLRVEDFRLQFEQRVLKYTDDSGIKPYDKLTQTWANFMGFTFWKRDEDFKLNDHIRLYDYTEPELVLPANCHEDDLKRVTGDLIARPWVEGRSPWEFLIVPKYQKKGEAEMGGSAVILRIHHALIDGYGILSMLLRFSNSLTAKRVLPSFPELSPSQRLTRHLLVLLKLPYDLAEFLVDSFDGPNCWHYLWKPLSRKYHVFFSDAINVETMKKIRRKYGVDYNATVYSMTMGSIQRLMLASGQELPQSISVFVPFPLPHHPGGLVVHASATCFKVNPRVASAKERIRHVGSNLKTLQELPTGPTACSWLTDIVALFPTTLIRPVHDKLMVTLGMTSIPGPEVEIPILGETNWTGMCWALGHTSTKAGAVASMMTMAGKQRIVLTVDKTIFEGYKVPARFAEFVNQEIEELLSESEM